MSTSNETFLRDLDQWVKEELVADVKAFGTRVAVTALQTASQFAAVDTGAMKAHLRPWVNTPDDVFDPGVTDQAIGTPLSGAQLLQAIARLNSREVGQLYGILDAAPYSSYVNQGTSKMAARPFFQRGIETADALVLKQSDPRLTKGINL